MKVVKFSKKTMKIQYFQVVEFPCFSTENWVFYYISWCRAVAEKSRKMALGENQSPNVDCESLFWCYLAEPCVRSVRSRQTPIYNLKVSNFPSMHLVILCHPNFGLKKSYRYTLSSLIDDLTILECYRKQQKLLAGVGQVLTPGDNSLGCFGS